MTTSHHPPELYHISFRDVPKKIWEPRLPDGFYTDNHTEPGGILYPEPDFPRISFSDDLLKCFYAIWGNVRHLYLNKGYPHLDFNVYTPVLTSRHRLIYPETLTQKKWVWDAHFTGEHMVTIPTQMLPWGRVRYFIKEPVTMLMTHPFNNPDNPLKRTGPIATFTVLDKVRNRR